jgi:hypothetical protein
VKRQLYAQRTGWIGHAVIRGQSNAQDRRLCGPQELLLRRGDVAKIEKSLVQVPTALVLTTTTVSFFSANATDINVYRYI